MDGLTQLIIPANCVVFIRGQQGINMVCNDTSAGDVEGVQLCLEVSSHLQNDHQRRNCRMLTRVCLTRGLICQCVLVLLYKHRNVTTPSPTDLKLWKEP